MPKKPKQRQQKFGRNSPCWCGSGKKYKDCHYPIEQAQRAEQKHLSEAQDTLMEKILAAAQQQPADMPVAIDYFWQGKYTPEHMSELDTLEDHGAGRFLTWFAFDHILTNGQTLVETLAHAATQGESELNEFEARLIPQWVTVRMRPYIVVTIQKGFGFTVHDMLDQQSFEVKDHGAPKLLEEGDILVGHLVPVGTKNAGMLPAQWTDGHVAAHDAPNAPNPNRASIPLYYIAGAVAQLTNDTQTKLIEFATLYLEDLRRTQPNATWSDLIRQRSHILNHFVMALPVEAYNPALLDEIIRDAQSMLQSTKEQL